MLFLPGWSMSVVRTLRVRVDWVQFPAARPKENVEFIRRSLLVYGVGIFLKCIPPRPLFSKGGADFLPSIQLI